MKIHSMTATFGKLDHQTLVLKPGLNVIEAPNEWGKSTWCAFLVAMLYGIDSRAHSATKTTLADKTRFDPWSGQLMSGRIELNWEGREITIERSSTKRSQMREFKAFETATGIPVPELTGENCGQVLLGVEKEVFQKAGFIRLSDMPVTQNEALRRRLNDLVTTGDESGAADTLAAKLNKLKNDIYLNRSKGLLPQLNAQLLQVQKDLEDLRRLKSEVQRLGNRQRELEDYQKRLRNHLTALQFAAAQQTQLRIRNAEEEEAAAALKVTQLQAQWDPLEDPSGLEQRLEQLTALQQQLQSQQMEYQMLPSLPQPPHSPVDGQTDPAAVAKAVSSHREAVAGLKEQLAKKPPLLWPVALLLAAAAVGLYFLHPMAALCAGILSIVLLAADRVLAHRYQKEQAHLQDQLAALSGQYTQQEAEAYAAAYEAYRQALSENEALRCELTERIRSLQTQIQGATNGQPLSHVMAGLRQKASLWQELTDARREHQRCSALVHTLRSVTTAAPPPTMADTMTHSESDTNRLLSDLGVEMRQLQLQLGHCQGQMATLGSEEALSKQLEEMLQREKRLKSTYAALTLAQETLAKATAQLQKRFAPRISQRAGALFSRMTGGRYDRLSLAEDLSLQVGAQDEDTLHGVLWRSEGTADQLYLALRLAVAQELTPNAPLVLDDALVRFDDARLQRAVAILQEEAEQKQVILFTCQQRESRCLENP